jgi:DNA polymerase-3 subunit delta'
MAGDDDLVAAPVWPELLPWQRPAATGALATRATWPHALLISGPRGIGKRTLALNFARSLLCESPSAEGLACGTCASCRYVAAGQHPDLQLVEPFTIDEDGEVKLLDAIPVDRIRALIDWALVTSHRGRAKVAIIVPAETLNGAAANALLKTLEEPPPDTFLLLVSHQPGRVPATLRSRCRHFVAPNADTDVARQWLADRKVACPATVLAQAGGAPLLALAMADPAWQGERAVWLQALAKPKALSAVMLAARLDTGPREERKQRLGLCHRLARGVDRRSCTGRGRRHPAAQSGFCRGTHGLGDRGGADPAVSLSSVVVAAPRAGRASAARASRRRGAPYWLPGIVSLTMVEKKAPQAAPSAGARPGVLSLNIREKAALYAAYMPFLKGGGIFIPTSRQYTLGEEVFMLLSLMDDPNRLAVQGKVVWLTPEGVQGNRTQGIGVQFTQDETGGAARATIEKILGETLGSTRPTHTM